jgi:hypothetical protein
MVCGLRKVCLAAIAVAGILALAPGATLADSCNGTSAVSIYSECVPSASGGSHHTGGSKGKTSTRGSDTGAVRASFRATPPSALGAVFDLGAGPTALFAMLAAGAILLFGIGGIRGRRQRRI